MSSGFNSGFSPPFFGVVSGSGGGGGTTLTGLLELTGSFSSRQYNGLAALSPSADFVLQPSGSNGSLLAQAPDGTTAGGNARGNNAVDWQQSRLNANQVASGASAVVGGGRRNRASGNYATVSGGQSNTASGGQSIVGGGQSNTASGTDSVVGGGNTNTASNSWTTVGGGDGNTASALNATIGGGQTNTASGNRSAVAGGELNTASANYAVVPGGFYALANQVGMLSHASGIFSLLGDAQYSRMILRRQTTNATPTVLSANGAAPGATTRVLLPARSMYCFDIWVSATQTAGAAGTASDSAWWHVRGGIKRDNSNNTTLVGSLVIETDSDAGATDWDLNVTADDTNNALQVEVEGEANKTIRWVATVQYTRVAY